MMKNQKQLLNKKGDSWPNTSNFRRNLQLQVSPISEELSEPASLIPPRLLLGPATAVQHLWRLFQILLHHRLLANGEEGYNRGGQLTMRCGSMSWWLPGWVQDGNSHRSWVHGTSQIEIAPQQNMDRGTTVYHWIFHQFELSRCHPWTFWHYCNIVHAGTATFSFTKLVIIHFPNQKPNPNSPIYLKTQRFIIQILLCENGI